MPNDQQWGREPGLRLQGQVGGKESSERERIMDREAAGARESRVGSSPGLR